MPRLTLLLLAALAGSLPAVAASPRPAPPPGTKELARSYVDFLEAQELAAQGRTREARARLESIVARDPAVSGVRPILARLCLRDGDLDCAHEQARRAIETEPTDADAHKVLAEIDMASYQGSTPPDRKTLESALGHLARAADADPRDPGVWIAWVRILGSEGRFAEAEEVTRRAAGVPGFDAGPLWLALARVMLARGETDRAIALLERVDASGRAAVPLLETLADLKGSRRDFAGQVVVIEKLRALEPEDPLVAQRLGVARLELGDAYGALEPLESALAENPSDPILRRDLARALVRLGRGQEALALLENIPDVYRSSHTLMIWAQAAEQAARYGEAADRLDQLIDGLQPSDRSSLGPTFGLREARNRVRAGQPARALEILATLPPEPPVLRLRLETLDALGRATEADALIAAQRAEAPGAGVLIALSMDRTARGGGDREAAALERGLLELRGAPDRAGSAAAAASWLVAWDRAPLAARLLDAVGMPEQPSAEVMRARAAVLDAAGRTGEAEAAYRQLLETAPDDAGALNDLGYLLVSQRRSLDEAVAMLRRAVEKQPDEPAFLDSLGWALYQSGRPQDALPLLQKAVRRAGERNEPDIREHLGDVYLALGQAERAVAEWQAALALDGGDRPDLRKKIEETRAASNVR